MNATTILLLVVAIGALFVAGCASPSAINQVDTDSNDSLGETVAIEEFVDADFILEDEFIEIGELI